MRTHFFTAVLLAAACSSCNSLDTTSAGGNGAHATVVMRDGKRLHGTITQSSGNRLTLLEDDKLPREIPTGQIQMVTYDAAPADRTNAAPNVDVAHEEHFHPSEAVIRSRTYLLTAGTELPVRLEETIDSSRGVEGQTYAAEIARDVADGKGDVVLPRGSNAVVVIRSVSKGNRFHDAADLQLDLRSVAVEGRKYLLDSSTIGEHGRDGVGLNKRTGIFSGGGAAVGSIIGALAGGGKGAAIGAGSGAGGGLLSQILTKGGSIKVPAETVLTFKLDQALRVTAAR